MTEKNIKVMREPHEQQVNVSREPFSIGGGDTYTAGTGLLLDNYEFSADTEYLATKSDLSSKQDTLTAGDNISISDNTISATDTTYTAGDNITISEDNVISAAGGGGGGSGIPTNATFWGQVYNSTNNRVVGMLDFTPDETTLGNKRYINTKGTYDLVIQTRSGDGTISLNVGNNSTQFQVSKYSINFKNKRGINLSTPTADGDAATKKYVDDLIAALDARITALGG